MRPFLPAFGAAMAMSLLGGQPSFGAAPGTNLIGDWQVEHVHNDQGATHTLTFTDDDQRLVGRFIKFGADKILFRTVDGEASCGASSIATSQIAAGALIAHTMAGRGVPPVAPNASISAMWLRCGSGSVGPGFDGGDAWFVDLPQHQLAMGYYGSTILVLASVPNSAPIQASFPCRKAATIVEKAICGSADLASFDRSVAASYGDDLKQFAVTGDLEATAKLKKSQQEWLRTRDKCGEDEKCLRKAMSVRLQVMADTAGFTGE